MQPNFGFPDEKPAREAGKSVNCRLRDESNIVFLGAAGRSLWPNAPNTRWKQRCLAVDSTE